MTAQSQSVLDDILDNGIKASAMAIAEIVAGGDVAVVMYKVQPGPGEDAARGLGWDGEVPVFRMSSAGRQRLIHALAQRDPVTVRWLKAKRSGRILVITGPGSTLLVNFAPGIGYSIEPGSTDRERLS